MAESLVSIATPNAARYLGQLCKHWSHRLKVEQSDSQARVDLPGALLIMTADPSALHMRLQAEQGETVEAMKDVIRSHLDRFAFREAPFTYLWSDR